MKTALLGTLALALLAGTGTAGEIRGHLETGDLPAHLRDRGDAMPLSMAGSYIQPGQFLIYPFFEYYLDDNFEYKPKELGHGLDGDFRGRYEATEELLFFAYGVSDRLAIEVEGALIQATLEKSQDDPSTLAPKLEESGVGDVEGQIRWRWARETPARPEVFSYFETVAPTQDEGALIGTTEWEFKLGSGVIRGYPWGTVTARAAVEYSGDTFDIGEVALEYVRRLSASWRVYAGVEGTQDEVGAIGEAQWHFARKAYLKLNSSFGVTSKATDWAPEVGVMLSL